MTGIAFHASLHRWAFFVTLTFASKDESGNALNVPGFIERRKMLFAFLREAANGRKKNKAGKRIESLPFARLLWLVREERGEQKGRYHFHILLDGLPPTRINKTECFALKAVWRGVGGGFADVRLYDTGLPGVSYVMKGLEQWSRVNANAYEMRKFTEDEQDRMLILSESCRKKWQHEASTRGASGGASDAVITGLRSLASRKTGGRKLSKEVTEKELRSGWGLNMHPAGISLVK
ncbi:MAG: hypothetical protein JNM99_10035 [Verrucomicrobiaceae bacterium]|nr:hypothetical protein [Verrucomicrobiaceae bacterium]